MVLWGWGVGGVVLFFCGGGKNFPPLFFFLLVPPTFSYGPLWWKSWSSTGRSNIPFFATRNLTSQLMPWFILSPLLSALPPSKTSWCFFVLPPKALTWLFKFGLCVRSAPLFCKLCREPLSVTFWLYLGFTLNTKKNWSPSA